MQSSTTAFFLVIYGRHIFQTFEVSIIVRRHEVPGRLFNDSKMCNLKNNLDNLVETPFYAEFANWLELYRCLLVNQSITRSHSVDLVSTYVHHHHHHQFIWNKTKHKCQGHVGTYRHHSNMHDRAVMAVQ